MVEYSNLYLCWPAALFFFYATGFVGLQTFFFLCLYAIACWCLYCSWFSVTTKIAVIKALVVVTVLLCSFLLQRFEWIGLGASLDGRVMDPTEQHPFGLVEVNNNNAFRDLLNEQIVHVIYHMLAVSWVEEMAW